MSIFYEALLKRREEVVNIIVSRMRHGKRGSVILASYKKVHIVVNPPDEWDPEVLYEFRVIRTASNYVLVSFVGVHDCLKWLVSDKSVECKKCSLCGKEFDHQWKVISCEKKGKKFHVVKYRCSLCGKVMVDEYFHSFHETNIVFLEKLFSQYSFSIESFIS